MTIFEELQVRHEELLRLQSQDVEILEDVQEYMRQARVNSSQVTGTRQREQLRANLRYWSGYVYEHTGTYPTTELAPAAETSTETRIAMPWWFLGAAVLVIVSGLFIRAILSGGDGGVVAGIPLTIPASSSEVPAVVVVTTATARPTDTPVPTETSMPTHTRTPTLTPPDPCIPPDGWVAYTVQQGDTLLSIAQLTNSSVEMIKTANCSDDNLLSAGQVLLLPMLPVPPTMPTLTPAPDLGSISVQLLSLQNDDFVSPREVISGTYQNLQPDWSIHALIQPVSGGNTTWFPAEDFFTIPDQKRFSGEWSIEVSFGEGEELQNPEQYRLLMVVANTKEAQEQLNAAVDNGFEEIPGSLLRFPPPIEVFRKAFVAIDEVRLVYASNRDETGNLEIVTTMPDGTDLRLLTQTHDIAELDPSVSPSGEQIALVQRTGTGLPDSPLEFALAIMDSDGQNRKLFTQPGDIDYEFPAWSPDGSQVAYSANYPTEDGRKIHQVWVYDLADDKNTQITSGALASRHPVWLPVGNEIAYETTGKDGSLGIFAIDTETKETRPLIDTEAQEANPFISSDGARMAYLYYTDPSGEGNRDIYLYDFSSGDSVQLTVHTGLDWRPSIHPDGDAVFFESHRQTGIPTIWAIEADGSDVRRISFNESSDSSPYIGLLKAFVLLESQ